MSTAVISTSAAQGRFFIFDDECVAGSKEVHDRELANSYIYRPQSAIKNQQSKILSTVTPASRLSVQPAPEMVSSGIAAIDTSTGGLPRGCLTEIFGPASSGRTTLLLAALAAATRRREFCAIVDGGDALDPQSVAAAGVDWNRLLWVRCGEHSPQSSLRQGWASPTETISSEHLLEQLLRAADLLLESGGFGLIALDLCDLPPQAARRIPLATWFRFRRAVEHTPTVLLAIERQAIAGSCSSLRINLSAVGSRKKELANCETKPTHAHLLTELEIRAEVVRSRMERKPARATEISFAGRTAWTG
jgi:recombination protein RecA